VITVAIEPLSSHIDLLPVVAEWFGQEWPSHYREVGVASAAVDAMSYSRRVGLPRGLVAFVSGQPCGFVALKSEPFPSHPHLTPWAGAAFVLPALRRRGIGRALLSAVEAEAAAQGHSRVYCATGTSASLLLRAGWQLLEQVEHQRQNVGVYEKVL
jgi:GNAT superfamily N-acetyltransferase